MNNQIPLIFVLAFLLNFSTGLFLAQENSDSKKTEEEIPEAEISELEIQSAQKEPKKSAEAKEENKTKEEELPEFVVTATRTKKKAFELPHSTTTINNKELRRKKPRNLPEALREVPGVMVQKTANGQGSPFIRGFTGFRTVMLIDGIRLNNSIFREGPNQYWATVDTQSLDRIEVVRGPSSVLYGSDAIGGVVQAFTKERKRYEKSFEVNGLLSTRYSSAEASIIGRLEGSANFGQSFGVLAGSNYKQFGDVDVGGDQGRLKRTGYYEVNGDAKMNFFINDDVELTAAYYLVDQENLWRSHRTVFSESFRNSSVGNEFRRSFDQERQMAYLRLKVDRFSDVVDAFTLTGAFHYQAERRDRLRANGRQDIQAVRVNTGALLGQFHSNSPIGKWTYGFEYYRDFVNSYREDFNLDGTLRSRAIQGPVADDSTYDLLGFYVQNEVEFHPLLKGTFGVRYTHAWLDANDIQDPVTGQKFAFSDNWGSFVGNINLLATVHKNVNLYAGASQGFRAPNLSDITRLDTARSNEIETPSPGLDPENFLTLEVGLNTKHEWFEGHMAYYYTFIDDMIIRFPTGRTIDGDMEIQKDNSGDGYVHGVELSGEVFLPQHFSIFGNFAWMEGRVSTFPTSAPFEEDEPIDRLQPAQGILGIKWHDPELGLLFEVSSRMTRQAKRLSTRDRSDLQRIPPEGTPGYGILTVRGEWEINEYCTISATIDNILDKHYRVHGSGQDEPGFNAILGIDLKF